MNADVSATVRMLEQLSCIFISCWFASGLAGFPRFRVFFAGRPQQAQFRRGVDELRQSNVTIFVMSRWSGEGHVAPKSTETGKSRQGRTHAMGLARFVIE